MNQQTHQISNYIYKDTDLLGEGSYGKVYKGKDILNGKEIAVKIIKNEVLKDRFMFDSIHKEIEVMKDLQSDYIVRLYGTFKDEINTYIFLELCKGGDLKKYTYKNQGLLPEETAISIFKQICQGFKVLIDHGYIHRDVKQENILINDDIFKLADFGFATKVDIKHNQKLHDIVGTPIYMSPQLLEDGDYSSKSDIWSLGILLYEMIYGRTPWACRDTKSYLKNIQLFPDIRFPYDKTIKEKTKDLIVKMLIYDENKRITWDELFKHPLIEVVYENLPDKVISIKIGQKVQKILENIQFMIQTNHIDFNKILSEYPEQLDQKQLYQYFVKLDARTTYSETLSVFDEIQKNGVILKQTVGKLFNRYDFHDLTDMNGRLLIELREIIKMRNLKLVEVFSQYDLHKKGLLQIDDFLLLIKVIAPRIKDYEIQGLFKYFDENNDGLIDFSEFSKKLSYALPNQDSNHYHPVNEKVNKILKELKKLVTSNKLDIKGIFSLFDDNKDKNLNKQEFKSLIYMIDPKAIEQDIQTVFEVFDEKHDGKITMEEFQNEINKI